MRTTLVLLLLALTTTLLAAPATASPPVPLCDGDDDHALVCVVYELAHCEPAEVRVHPDAWISHDPRGIRIDPEEDPATVVLRCEAFVFDSREIL